MAQEETVILHLDIDEQPAVQSIKDLRAANTELRKSRDGVNIATKEGQELVQKLNVAIDKNNATIKANSSALEKQRQNVGNYTNSIKDAANELNIMGVNVGQLGAKLSSFINPVTAVVGVLGALGTAYANSTRGAKDLEFASTQLSEATTLLSNSFAELVTSGEDGEGFFTTLLNSALFKISPSLAVQSRALALFKEQLDDLSRDEITARSNVNDRLSDNQDLLVKIQDSQTSINDKLFFADQMATNININSEELLKIKEEQLRIAQSALKADADNEEKQTALLNVQREISNIEKDRARRLAQIQKLQSNISDENNKQLAAQRATKEIQDEADRNAARKPLEAGGSGISPMDTAGAAQIDSAKALSDGLKKITKDTEDYRTEQTEKSAELRVKIEEQSAMQTIGILGLMSEIAGQQTEEGKALAVTQIALNTGIGIAEAVKAGAGVAWPLNLVAILSGITAVLAGVSQAKSALGFAEGGFTGSGGKYEPAGIVHKGEYVVPQNVNYHPAAQPHIAALERMRTGYADGGFVANTNTQPYQMAMIQANAIKNLPSPVVSVVEVTRVQKQVRIKENISSL